MGLLLLLATYAAHKTQMYYNHAVYVALAQ